MAFKELKADFDREVLGWRNVSPRLPGDGPKPSFNESSYKFWMLRLLFEIAGNLDSLVVSYRELVKLNKEKAAKK